MPGYSVLHSSRDDSKGVPAGTNIVSEINSNLGSALKTFPESCSRFMSSNPTTYFQEQDRKQMGPSSHFSRGNPHPSQRSDFQKRDEDQEYSLLLLFWGVDKIFFGFIQKRNTLHVHIIDITHVALTSAPLQLLHITPHCA